MNRITLIVIVCMLMFSCAQKKKKEVINDVTLITHIKNNGVKEFSYSATLSQKKKPAGSRSHNKGGGGRGGAAGGRGGRGGGSRGGNGDRSKNDSSQGISEKMKSKIYQDLNKRLRTGFCRDGFVETEVFFDKKYIQIKGVCNERATNSDRKRYPNN
mgnify:CR=1 FL=1